ncbi:MAG TPA: bifunctional UDP-N-acetylmuramoyl-tripeptide:D-alanyl-D-alanine ligase/alanine racemase [Puia sp.]|nr:bifunctional UDP-N-acetylmuramoyl-tripeptide:D-alanyl-D-alanine ligase/alanine racemase [Puia sp.]
MRHIASIVAGSFLQFHQDDPVEQLLTDSRRLFYPETTLFFALYGQRRNGQAFIPDLYLRGVRNFIIYDALDSKDFPEANFILVKDSLRALQLLAAFHRLQFDIPVLGITGSNGKTIVKEWLNQLLEDQFQIVRSPRSYNSQIGVPLSIWQINVRHNLALIEAGISQMKEMRILEEMIKPTLGVFTNIGEAHDQGFENTETKIREKLELFKDSIALIYPSDQKELKKVIRSWHALHPALELISIGKQEDAVIQIKKIEKLQGHTAITLIYKNQSIYLEIGFEDNAAIQNALTSIGVMLYLKIPVSELQSRVNRLNPLAMRMELKTGINHSSVINDSYSADISSLTMALDFLFQQKQHSKRTLILSDILETGRKPQSLYKEVAGLLRKYPVDRLIGVGEQLVAAESLFNESGIKDRVFFGSTDALMDVLPKLEFRDETILLKGARVFGFERIDQELSLQVHETLLEVNLEAMAHNLNQYQQILRPSTKIMAMVKAFSYGTGGFEIARLLEFHKVDYLGVAFADEGISLRKAGIRLPIIVMNPEENAMAPFIEWQLEPVIFSFRGLKALYKLLKDSVTSHFPIHIELETGLNRLGFSAAEIPDLIEQLKKEPAFRVQSVFSHLAASEEPQQDDFTQEQFDRYLSMTGRIRDSLGYTFIQHISNSAGLVRNPVLQLDMVRLGIGLYGIDPASSGILDLKEVGTLKTTIAQIKKLGAGETVGYNRQGLVDHSMKIGTLRLGYADGYPRSLGNGVGKVLYKGRLVPTIGSISMDMTMIDISEIPDAKEGDELIIFGNELSVSKLASWAGTIAYDILAGISQRVKRVYFE